MAVDIQHGCDRATADGVLEVARSGVRGKPLDPIRRLMLCEAFMPQVKITLLCEGGVDARDGKVWNGEWEASMGDYCTASELISELSRRVERCEALPPSCHFVMHEMDGTTYETSRRLVKEMSDLIVESVVVYAYQVGVPCVTLRCGELECEVWRHPVDDVWMGYHFRNEL